MSSKRKAQTSLEMLFIIAIILTGLVSILSPALHSEEGTTIAYAVRSSASDACSYLANAVLVNESPYSPLNSLIEYFNYTPVTCRLKSFSTDVGENVRVSVVFSYNGPAKDRVQDSLRQFMLLKLASYTGFRLENGGLYYGNKPVILEVSLG